MTSQSQLTIYVTDTNDHAPQFTDRDFYSAELSESTKVGSLVARLTATDADDGENGRVTYRLVEDADARLFSVDSETGALRTRAALDRESVPRHRIAVAAVDAGSHPRSATAIVELIVGDVDDERPRFTLPVYSFRVAENHPPGTEVGTVAARDADGDPFNDFRFRLVADNASAAAAAFEVDPTSGLITTRLVLDREQRALYVLTIVVEPPGNAVTSGMSSTVVANVQVSIVDIFIRNLLLK